MQKKEALLEAKIPGKETGIEIKKTICTICDPMTQCGLDISVKDGKVIKVEGSDGHPFNNGAICPKGAATRQYLYSEKRIRTPLRRVGPRGSGQFEPISWDEALDIVAKKCLELKEKFGPESVIFFSGYTKYFRPFLSRLAFSFGSPNYCTESSTCNMATLMAQKLVFGTPGGPDLPFSDCMLVWSCNPYYTGHGRAQAIDKKIAKGMKLIAVDPRITPTTERAHIHLRPRPGTDGALALSMANVIIEENLYDAELVGKYAYGFDEYKAYVKSFTPERGEELTGVPAEKIRAAARMYATAERACIQPSASPVVHHTNGVQNYRAIFMLAALTGNYDIRGGNYAEPPSWLYVTAKFTTREEEFKHPRHMEDMAPRIGADRFPVWMELAHLEAQSMVIPEQLRSGKPYPLKAMLSFGLNYRMWPDSEGFKKSLEKLDFIMNTDIFMTDSCRLADIVLPVCTSLERSELRCYGTGYVQLSQPVIPPLYESRSDVDVMYELAKRICPDDKIFAMGYEKTLDWILEPSGMTVAELKKHPGGMPVKNPINPPERKYMNGAKTPSGKLEFKSKMLEKYGEKPGMEALPIYYPPKYSAEASPEMAKEYPLILNTGSRLPMFIHSRANHLSWTQGLRPLGPSVDVNPEDAAMLGIKAEDDVRLSTPFGAIEVKANPTLMVMPGVVHMYHGITGADVNSLLSGDYLDPISGFPGFKSALCKLEKIAGKGAK